MPNWEPQPPPWQGGKTDATDLGKDHSPQDKIVPYCIQANMTTIATTCTTVNTKEALTYDELLIDVINYGTVGDTHPEKIVVGDVHAPWCNEAYTTVQLPTSASSKGTASLCIKVDTGAGGNVLPLGIFKCLYPNWINPAGLPTGLDHVITRLTAYNRSHTPLYGTFHGPITWWPGCPGAQPHKVNSYWYVEDPPSCHPRSPIMQKVSSCKDELYHHSCPI